MTPSLLDYQGFTVSLGCHSVQVDFTSDRLALESTGPGPNNYTVSFRSMRALRESLNDGTVSGNFIVRRGMAVDAFVSGSAALGTLAVLILLTVVFLYYPPLLSLPFALHPFLGPSSTPALLLLTSVLSFSVLLSLSYFPLRSSPGLPSLSLLPET